MSWNSFRTKLVEQITNRIWAQWNVLGVRSTGRFKPVAVDLEALLVGTWSFGRTDPRLFDEALNWCCQFGDFANVKRLQKLLVELDDPTTIRLALAWMEVIEEHSGIKWNLNVEPPEIPDKPQNLFFGESLESEPSKPARESIFTQWGFARGKFEHRKYTTAPDLTDLQLAQLFARKFMGGGGRSELLATLLLGVEATTRELATMTVYSRRYIQKVLDDLNATGLLDWEPGRGRTTRVSLRKGTREKFRSFITGNTHPGEPYRRLEIRDWPGFFLGFHALWRAAIRITQSGFEGFKAQALLRDGLEEAVQYHGRTSLQASYRPRLAADSLESLLWEAETYLDSIFVEEPSADAEGTVTSRRRQ